MVGNPGTSWIIRYWLAPLRSEVQCGDEMPLGSQTATPCFYAILWSHLAGDAEALLQAAHRGDGENLRGSIDMTCGKENSIHLLTTNSLGFNVDAEMEQEVSKAAAILGRKGGKVRTKAKIRAARKNGKLGGRPKKETAAA